jgi:hypothetical protein
VETLAVSSSSRKQAKELLPCVLVDGNNFYAELRAVFRPSLAGHPVVLSNNGCAIARSNQLAMLYRWLWFEIEHRPNRLTRGPCRPTLHFMAT